MKKRTARYVRKKNDQKTLEKIIDAYLENSWHKFIKKIETLMNEGEKYPIHKAAGMDAPDKI